MHISSQTHKTILVKILRDIFTDPFLSQVLAFKGGTALYLFYELSRFSVDLDFDCVDTSEEAKIMEKIHTILASYGTIKEEQNKRYTLFFLLSYAPETYNIKVEINKRNFGSSYEIKSLYGIPMRVMLKKDMFAHKIVAFSERFGKASRDLYDVWFMLENGWEIEKNIVEQRTQMTFQDFINTLITRTSSYPPHQVLSGIGDLLDPKQKSWVKSHLISEVCFLLQARFIV